MGKFLMSCNQNCILGSMDACFHHWIKTQKVIETFYLPILTFFPQLHDKYYVTMSELCDYILGIVCYNDFFLSKQTSYNSDIITRNSEWRKKSQR